MTTVEGPATERARTGRAIDTERLLRNERLFVKIRWFVAAWALFQVLSYYRPYPRGVFPIAVALVGLLVAGNAIIWLSLKRVSSPLAIRRLALASLALDGAVLMGQVYVYTFDEATASFAVIYLFPLSAVTRFDLPGALWSMGIATVLYTIREIYGHIAFGNDLLFSSITLRMGIGFIIGIMAGMLSSALVKRNRELGDLNRDMSDYLHEVGHVVDAAGAVEDGTFEPASLDGVARRDDALGQLARVFQTMAREVAAREERLRREVQQLRIEIDETRAARSVAEITESDYFRRLQKKVKELRIESGS